MAIELPTKPAPRPEPSLDGSMMLVLGEPKSGKSYLVNKWENCLVIDTQGGHRSFGGMVLDIRRVAEEEGKSDYQVLKEVTARLVEHCPYEAVALDTLDDVSGWFEAPAAARCCKKMNKAAGFYPSIEDVPHGAGWGEHRRMVMGLVKVYHRLPCTVILVAHSRRLIDEEAGAASKMVDLPGRLGHMVPGEVDHIAVSGRDKDGSYYLDFSGYEGRGQKGATVRQSGSRLPELNGKVVATSQAAILAALKEGVVE